MTRVYTLRLAFEDDEAETCTVTLLENTVEPAVEEGVESNAAAFQRIFSDVMEKLLRSLEKEEQNV